MCLKNISLYIKKQVKENRILNLAVKVTGVLFLFLAILGFLLPVIPGIFFLAIGLLLLGEEFFISRWIIGKMPKSARERLKKKKENNNIE